MPRESSWIDSLLYAWGTLRTSDRAMIRQFTRPLHCSLGRYLKQHKFAPPDLSFRLAEDQDLVSAVEAARCVVGGAI